MPHEPGHRVRKRSDEEALEVLSALASQYPNLTDFDIPEVSEDRLTSYSPSQQSIFEQRANLQAGKERFDLDEFRSETSPGDVLTGITMIPGVGDLIGIGADIVNVPYTAVTGKDIYSGVPMGPLEATAWGLGTILIPNIIQGVGKRIFRGSRQAKKLGNEFLDNLGNVTEDGGDVASYIPANLLDAPMSTRSEVAEAIEEHIEESIALDPDFTPEALTQLRRASEVILRGRNLGKNLPGRISAGKAGDTELGSYVFQADNNPNSISYILEQPGGIRNSDFGIGINRADEGSPWNMNLQVPPGQNQKATFKLLQEVTDQIKVGEKFRASLSSDSYPLFLRLVDRSKAVKFDPKDIQYKKLNLLGRRGTGEVEKGILGLTSEQTQRVLGGNLIKDEANEFKKIIDANLPAGLKTKLKAFSSGYHELLFPIPLVERVAERTSKAFLRKGGYVVKKKRKKGYGVKKL